MKKMLKVFGISALLALVLGAGAMVVGAQAEPETEEAPAGENEGPRGELRSLMQEIFNHDDAEAVIAGLLGISVEELEAAKEDGTIGDLMEEAGLSREDVHAAISEARNAAIDAAAANGTITEEQAEMLRNVEGRGGRRGGRHGGGIDPELAALAREVFDRDSVKAAVAEVLGLTVEELEAAKEDGTSMSELAEAVGVEMEDIQAAVEAAKDAAIEQALADGTITAEQAEQLSELEGHGGRRGHRGGHGPRGGGNGNGPAAPDTNDA